MIRLKLYFLTIFTLLHTLPITVMAQDSIKFQINIHNLVKEHVIAQYDDGLEVKELDLSQHDSCFTFKKASYTPYPRVTVIHKESNKSFFINNNKAVLNIDSAYIMKESAFDTLKNLNVSMVYDTVSNPGYRELRRKQMPDLSRINYIMVNQGSVFAENDSLKYELSTLAKAINKKGLDYIRTRPNEFLSFYYFKDQIMGVTALFIGADSSYYSMMLDYYSNVFPEKYRQTPEGEKLKTILVQKSSSFQLKENDEFPAVILKDLQGKPIVYKRSSSNFILLDFWASWCPPCIKQIPDIKKLNEEFADQDLKIIGISIDRDSAALIESIKEHGIDWQNSHDRGSTISTRLGVTSIPVTVLINHSGKIVYLKNGGQLDVDKIRNIIMAD